MDDKTEADQEHKQAKQNPGQWREALSHAITRLTGIRKKGQKVMLWVLSFLGFLATLSGVLFWWRSE